MQVGPLGGHDEERALQLVTDRGESLHGPEEEDVRAIGREIEHPAVLRAADHPDEPCSIGGPNRVQALKPGIGLRPPLTGQSAGEGREGLGADEVQSPRRERDLLQVGTVGIDEPVVPRSSGANAAMRM